MGNQKHFVVWFTGLSGSGKTTLAKKLVATLEAQENPAMLVDGDEIRNTLTKHLGFSKEDIEENHRVILEVCDKHLAEGKNVVVSTISPLASVRERARAHFSSFVEVYCDCPLKVCMMRDPKGHYKRVVKGETKNFIGIESAYEAPAHPDITLHTGRESTSQSLKKIVGHLQESGYL